MRFTSAADDGAHFIAHLTLSLTELGLQ